MRKTPIPCYFKIRQCSTFWSWLFFSRNSRFPEYRICGWDFYGWTRRQT